MKEGSFQIHSGNRRWQHHLPYPQTSRRLLMEAILQSNFKIKITKQAESHPGSLLIGGGERRYLPLTSSNPGLIYCIEPSKGIMNSKQATHPGTPSAVFPKRNTSLPPCPLRRIWRSEDRVANYQNSKLPPLPSFR